MKTYIFDSNSFITPYNFCPMDVFPSLWEKILELIDQKVIVSIDKVKDEIFCNEDELKRWIETNINTSSFFENTNTYEILECYQEIVTWAEENSFGYKNIAINDFLDYNRADAWLIAFALYLKNKNITPSIVTYEKISNKKTVIKIPNVCKDFNIEVCNLIDLLRELNIKF